MRLFRNTDLPVPDGPRSTLISPAGSVSVTSDQMTDRSNDLVSPSTTTSTPTLPELMVDPQAGLARSWALPGNYLKRLRVGDLPAAVDPLRRDGQPAGGQQWLVLTDLMSLLIDEDQHDRPVAIERLDCNGGNGRHYHGLLWRRQLPYFGELLMKAVDERAGDDLACGSFVGVEPSEVVGVDALHGFAYLSRNLGGGVLIDQRLVGRRRGTGQLVGLAGEPGSETHGHHPARHP